MQLINVSEAEGVRADSSLLQGMHSKAFQYLNMIRNTRCQLYRRGEDRYIQTWP